MVVMPSLCRLFQAARGRPASDGTFPALLVVVRHGLDLLLVSHRREHTDPSATDASISPAGKGGNRLGIILSPSALR